MTTQPRAIELATTVVKATGSRKDEDVIILDVSGPVVTMDVFVLVSADNERLVATIVDEIEDGLRDLDIESVRRGGVREGCWALLDYGDVVVYASRGGKRDFYNLGRLWRDCPRVEAEGIEQPSSEDSKDSTRSIRSINEIPLATENPDTDEF